MLDQIDPKRLHATVEALAKWNTRNTNTPELTQAAEWIASEYRKIPGMQVEIWHYTIPKGRRVPEEKQVVEVIAKLQGEDDRLVMVGGHMDSINLSADIFSGRAPGANDDASGTALALELARVMSTKKWKHSLMFIAFSGEEQGLNGSQALAKRAKDENWQIEAFLNNDMVSNTTNDLGKKDDSHVRVFSEESDKHQSRELARFIEWVCRGKVKSPDGKTPFEIKLVLRKDRFGRGGDHSPFNDQGFNAVRFVEVEEAYTRQHTPNDLPEFSDPKYHACIAKMNLLAMSALAQAGTQPSDVLIKRDQSHHTTISWHKTDGVKYMVYWRDTASAVWQGSKEVGEADHAVIENVNKDDHMFAVGAMGGIPVPAK